MISISKNVHIDTLDDTVNKYNNTYHSAIKIQPVDVKSRTYIDLDIENNDKAPKFKIADRARIWKYKNTFAKGYISNWSKEVHVIKKVKNTVPWTSLCILPASDETHFTNQTFKHLRQSTVTCYPLLST